MPSQNSGRRQFIESPSRASKNFSKGEKLEKKISKQLHTRGIPLLVSSLLLRDYACGQVDMAVYHQGHITLYEVKSCPGGINRKQKNRLKQSLKLLIHVFNASGDIHIINKLPKD